MVREATITQEQVNAAADALRAAGAKPTVRAVRERLGNTGSNATVMKLLAVWQGGQVKPAETPLMLPAALQRALVDYVGQAVAEGKAALAADLAELQQINADLAAESERQAAMIELLEGELEASQRDRDALAGRGRQLEEDLALARGEADQERGAAEGARTELAKAQLRLEAMPRLETELAALRTALQAERDARAVAEQAAAVARATQEGESKALAKAEKDLAAAHAELEKRQAHIYGLSDEIHKRQAVANEADAKLARAEEKLRAVQEELDGGGADARAIARLEEARRQALQQGRSEAHLQRLDEHIEARKQLMAARLDLWASAEPATQKPDGGKKR
ncbi:DNA-binding protein [Cupriavidus necator]